MATAKLTYRFQYAAKFICTANIPGTSQTTDAFVAGAYQTAVNIHNPQRTKVRIRKKIASPIDIYTAAPNGGQVSTMDVERVEERKL